MLLNIQLIYLIFLKLPQESDDSANHRKSGEASLLGGIVLMPGAIELLRRLQTCEFSENFGIQAISKFLLA